jgi:ankyrin repeat protein
MCDWAKEFLTTEETENKMLLATDSEGHTAWHWAAYRNKLNFLQKVWDLAKENLTTGEIKDTLLLATNSE